MSSHPLLDFIRRLRRARSVTEGGHLTDVQLLARFAKDRDEAAFEVLVWRHGTMVLNVARRLLRQTADAEDVFQATFLTLARKAAAIRRGTSLGSWLYKVAYRLALRASQTAARRQRQQQQSRLENVAAAEDRGDPELSAMLAAEVSNLPERYRAVVVLCYLQGATTEEAARLLGCPRGTVLSRLSSARQRLRQRLVRRGIAPAVALAAVSFGESVSVGPSTALAVGVVAAALSFAAGGAAVPMVSLQAAALAKGVMRAMLWNKIKIVALTACMIALVGTGSGWLARGRSAGELSLPAAEPQVKKEALPKAAAEPADKIKQEIARIHTEMNSLEQKNEFEERSLSDAAIQARIDLLQYQEELRFREDLLESEREARRSKLKEMQSEIAQLEKTIEEFAAKAPAKPYPSLQATKQRKKSLEKQLEEMKIEEVKLFRDFRDSKRDIRQEVIKAEEKVSRIETLRSRQREDFVAQRERWQARLQMLADKALGIEPADRLRELEHKLDALRREVSELRRERKR